MKRLLVTGLVVILLFSFAGQVSHAQDTTSDSSEEYIIVFDESHEQFFDSDLMKTALSSLNDSLDTANTDVTVKLVVQTQRFTTTNIQGSDLVIITNPGEENDSLSTARSSEADALELYVNNGGSIFYMTNPLSNDKNITGHARAMNILLYDRVGVSIPTTSVSSAADNDNTTVIMDEINFVENETFVKVSPRNFDNPVLAEQLNNITNTNDGEIIIHSAGLSTETSMDITGNTSTSAYSVGFTPQSRYQITNYQTSPKWLHAKTFEQDQGRVIVSGSTVMFSDYAFNSTADWIEMGQNLALFQNIVAWVMGITPVPEQQPVVTEQFSFFIRINLFYAIAISTGLFLIIFGTYWSKGRIGMTNLFNIFTEDRDKKSKKKKKEEETKVKTPKRRERRKRT